MYAAQRKCTWVCACISLGLLSISSDPVLAGPSMTHGMSNATLAIAPAPENPLNDAMYMDSHRLGRFVLEDQERRTAPAFIAIALRSKEGNIETEIEFINNMDEPVSVYWIDYEGNEQKYKTLSPREKYTQNTYVTHPWIVRKASDNEPVGHVVGRIDKQTLDIGATSRQQRADGAWAALVVGKQNCGASSIWQCPTVYAISVGSSDAEEAHATAQEECERIGGVNCGHYGDDRTWRSRCVSVAWYKYSYTEGG